MIIINIILVMPLRKIQIKWRFDLFLSGEAVQESQLGKSYRSSLNVQGMLPSPRRIAGLAWFPPHNFALEKEVKVSLQRSVILGVILLLAFVMVPF